MTDQAFQELRDQISGGESAGLRRVFEETHRYCVRTLMKKTQCAESDAEDLYMDAVLVFRENVLSGKLQRLTNLKTYLFGICWNLWRDLRRAKAKWGPPAEEVERQMWLIAGQEGHPFAEEGEEIRESRIRTVKEALSRLGDTCRQLLTYVYVERRRQKDIAELMGMANANVVKVTRHRCYQQWMKHVQQATHGS